MSTLEEQARRRRERVLGSRVSRMEAVGGEYEDEEPDKLESEKLFEQRVFDRWSAQVSCVWYVCLVAMSGLYGMHYASALWPNATPARSVPGLSLVHPVVALLVGEALKYFALLAKLPKEVAASPTIAMLLDGLCKSYPLFAPLIRLASLSPTIYRRYKLVGDLSGDLCLALCVLAGVLLAFNAAVQTI